MSKTKTKAKIPETETKPIILVDTSYTSFYRFFATIRWFSFAYPEEFKDLKTLKTNQIV